MTYGLLGSVVPAVGVAQVVYTGISSSIAVGKVSICNKNYNPARIQVGYKEDGSDDIKYFEYNRIVNFGESLETGNIHLSESTPLIVRSNQEGVNFVFYGESITDTQNPVKSGIFNQLISTDKTVKTLYQAPVNSKATVTLTCVNVGVEKALANIGISDSDSTSFDSSEYLEYLVEILPGQTYTRPDIKLNTGQSVVCASSIGSNLSFIAHGQLSYVLSVDDVSIVGNLGIGTTASSTARLDVLGDVSINEGGVSVNNIQVLSPEGGFNIGITSSYFGQNAGIHTVATGPVRGLNFLGIGNTFKYNPDTDVVDIDTGDPSGVSSDDRLGCMFLHYGGFQRNLSIKSPQKFHEIYSHEDAAVDIESGVEVSIEKDCLLVVTDKDTFDSFNNVVGQTNLLTSIGFKDNIRTAFDATVNMDAARKVGYVMIPGAFQDSIACDIEEGVTVSVGDFCVLNIGGTGASAAGSEEAEEMFDKEDYFIQQIG